MSAVAPSDPAHASSPGLSSANAREMRRPAQAPADPPTVASKKKGNKKKKNAKGKSNGDAPVGNDAVDSPMDDKDGEGDGEEPDSALVRMPPVRLPKGDKSKLTPAQTATKDSKLPETLPVTNGHGRDSTANGHSSEQASGTADASSRLEAMSQDREALRAEVEQLRKSLEDIQGKHSQEITSIKSQHSDELSKAQGKHTEEVSTIKAELEDTQAAKEQAETQYQHLLGRINTIKASLGERLKADKQELEEAKEQIEELETQNSDFQKKIQALEAAAKRTGEESEETSKELSSLRNRHNLSQENWVHEREDMMNQIRHLKDEAEAAKDAMGDWEVLAMEEKRMRESLSERVADLEEQYSSQKESYELAITERDTQSQTVGGLQRALQEVQDARKRELREMVESYEEQLQSLKKLVQESDTRATEADASKGALQTELDRLAPFEKEVKEKNLLIGKLRHEAIVLNDHLTKALRFLKKAKPEDNIDRQIVTNHFLHFLALDRSDPKKFQILQLIAALLNWTDEQKEQAGLARPGTAYNSLRLPTSPFHRTPSTPSLASDFFTEPPATKESLAELWTGFLERSAEEGVNVHSRSGSISSTTLAPESRAGDESAKE